MFVMPNPANFAHLCYNSRMDNTALTLSKTTLRRFVMGKQGLWPGRRWAGLDGTTAALTASEAIQEDPLVVVARSHDLALQSRVLDYQPEHLMTAIHQQRGFFEYGDCLYIYPMHELPCWRTPMRRRLLEGRWARLAAEQPALLDEVRQALKTRGPLGNRDFSERAAVHSYRGRKDSALALYALWLSGELMIHHRKGFERVYDFDHQVAPAHLLEAAAEAEAEAFFARKAAALWGVAREQNWRLTYADYIHRRVTPEEGKKTLDGLFARGVLAPVNVEGSKDRWLMLAEDLPLLREVEAGLVPAAWQPLGPTTCDEVTLLAPLEMVSARGRAKTLFDFDYVWEVYKPVQQRRWGYYTLPVLYGDRLVARLDPRLERAQGTLRVMGFWLEDPTLAADPAFAAALQKGLARFAGFLNARSINLDALDEPGQALLGGSN